MKEFLKWATFRIVLPPFNIYRIYQFRNMNTLTNKLPLRYSTPHTQFTNANQNKSSSFLTRTFAAKRLNTEGDAKPAHSKYLLKKGSKIKPTISNNHSKENLNPYRASDYLNRISYNDFDFSHQNH